MARTYVYGEDAFVPLARIDSASALEGALWQKKRYLHTDHLGKPLEVTDANGAVSWRAKYRAWGSIAAEIEAPNDSVLDIHNEVVVPAQPIRLQGQYYDTETALHYNLFRYFDADIGRFISIDPIGLAGGLNTFRFALNPTGWVDPLGLTPCRDSGVANSGQAGRFGMQPPAQVLLRVFLEELTQLS